MIAIDLAQSGKHLRLILFTLVISCVGLIAVLTADPSGENRVAFAQFQEIEKVVARWNEDWLQTYARRTAGGVTERVGLELNGAELMKAAPRQYEYFKNHALDRDGNLAFSISVTKWSLFSTSTFASLNSSGQLEMDQGGFFYWPRAAIGSGRGVSDFKVDPPRSLSEFRKLWQALGLLDTLHVLSKLDKKAQFYPGHTIGKSESELSWVSLDTVSAHGLPALNFLRTHLAVLTPEDRSSGDWWREDFADWPSETKIIVEVVDQNRWAHFEIPGQFEEIVFPQSPRTYLGSLEGLEWDDQGYSESFPELSKVTSNIDEIPFNKMRRHLRKVSRQPQEHFTAFGLKVPGNVLTSWGGILVFGLQFYFFLHLRNFIFFLHLRNFMSKNADAGPEIQHVPWIGFYNDKMSRISYFFTAAILPCAVIIALVSYTIQDAILATEAILPWLWPLQTWIPIIFLGLIIAVSFGVGRCIFRARPGY